MPEGPDLETTTAMSPMQSIAGANRRQAANQFHWLPPPARQTSPELVQDPVCTDSVSQNLPPLPRPHPPPAVQASEASKRGIDGEEERGIIRQEGIGRLSRSKTLGPHILLIVLALGRRRSRTKPSKTFFTRHMASSRGSHLGPRAMAMCPGAPTGTRGRQQRQEELQEAAQIPPGRQRL